MEGRTYCPDCLYYGRDCNVDPEDWEKPCDAFEALSSEGVEALLGALTTILR